MKDFNFLSTHATLSLDSDISVIAKDIYTLIYQHPYINGEPRTHHGMSHVLRAMFMGTVGYNLIGQAKVENSKNITQAQINLERKIIQIALLLHDAGREGDGVDEEAWEDDSAIIFYRYAVTRLHVDPALALKVTEAMRNKDWEKGQPYKSFNPVTETFDDIDMLDPLPPAIERLRLSIHYGDCMDIHRVAEFDRSYLLIEKKYPENEILKTSTTEMITESKQLFNDYRAACETSVEAHEKYNGAEAFEFTQQSINKNQRLKELTSPSETDTPLHVKTENAGPFQNAHEKKLEEVKDSVVNHLKTMIEMKKEFAKNAAKNKNQPADDFESQSALHLRSLLGKQYDKDMSTNVSLAVEKLIEKRNSQHQLIKLTDKQKENLKIQCDRLMENEKEAGDSHVFSYHGCPREIAFAYDVYTAFNRILFANEQWHALRPTHEHFKKFRNIVEFIEYYSSGGTKIINNYAPGFPEAAIAANWALFGNHESDTSCSLTYFLTNHSHLSINLPSMLKAILPSEMPEHILEALLAVFNQQYPDPFGVLYQFSQSPEDADLFSYIASSAGPLNPYQGTYKPSEIRMLLKNDLDSGDEEKIKLATQYLSNVQVRLMVAPSQKFAVNRITLQHLNDASLSTQSSGFFQETLINDLVNELLLHLSQELLEDERTPAMVMMKGQLEKNALSVKKIVSRSELKRAFHQGNFEKVKQYIETFPEITDYAMVLCVEEKNEILAKWIVKKDPEIKVRNIRQHDDI